MWRKLHRVFKNLTFLMSTSVKCGKTKKTRLLYTLIRCKYGPSGAKCPPNAQSDSVKNDYEISLSRA